MIVVGQDLMTIRQIMADLPTLEIAKLAARAQT
jgi:hypothetical protein